MRTKDCHFDERNVHELWELVKDPESFWGDLGLQSRHLLKALLEDSMLAWREGYVQVPWHETGPGRRDHCNGFYLRKCWPTEVGALNNVRVPRCRTKGLTQYMKTKVGDGLEQVSDQVIEMFLAGVSTRRVGELLERITGLSVSPGSVSRLAKKLDEQVRVFHSRSLQDRYKYLFLDGLHLKARGQKVSPIRAKRNTRKRIVLAAYGLTVEGIKELIDFALVDGESARDCENFLWNLYHRGLKGAKLELIISDRSGGLTAAGEQVYPFVPKQGCWFHKMANVSRKVAQRDRAAVLGGLRKVYAASDRKAAVAGYRAWAKRWARAYPEAVRCVEKDLQRLLSFYAMPRAHWKILRTTNAIERCFRELRRRTDSIGTFLDDTSISRLIFALMDYLNRKRAGKVCKEFKTKPKLAA
jgi:transposase-like protein